MCPTQIRTPANIKISPRPITKAPLERIHMDIFGIDKNYFLSFVCAFSKHLQLIKIESRNTIDIQSGLTRYISTFGTPRKIVCDHECSFRSIQLRGFLDSLEIELEFASSSEYNGQVEKTHSTIIEIFNTNKQKFTSLNTADIIQLTVSLYNNSVHSATNFTPNEIVFHQTNTLDPRIIMTQAKEIFDKVICNLEKAKKTMENNNEKKEEPPTIQKGNGVLYKKGVRKKLDPRFHMTTCL